jgi:hypothetical protein
VAYILGCAQLKDKFNKTGAIEKASFLNDLNTLWRFNYMASKKKGSFIPWFILGVVVIIGSLVGLQMATEKSTNIEGLSPGTSAPSFTLQSTEGDISLEDYKGKNVVLYFYEGNA